MSEDNVENEDYLDRWKVFSYTNMPGDRGVEVGYAKASKTNPDVINLRFTSLPLPNNKGQVWAVLLPYDPERDGNQNV